MLRGESSEIQLLSNRVTEFITRYRTLIFIGVALLYVLSFNGRWRLGRDTGEYRGLALSLADGKGYTFGTWAPKQIYPGLPCLLAGIEKLLGPAKRTPGLAEDRRLIGPSAATTASVLVIVAMAGLTLWITYRLLRLHYAPWIATVVTACVGTNAIFISHANELLTDVPFLLGVMAALYGWDLLLRAPNSRAGFSAAGIALFGVALAAVMRPTFWILAVCWVIQCIWGLITGPRRIHAICLGVLLATGLARFGLNPFDGGYEREARRVIPQMLRKLPTELPSQVHAILRNDIPAAVFGEQLAPASVLGSLLVLGSTLLLFRHHALWVLMVFATVGATLLLSSEARYYMMVLPILLLGWLTLTCALASRLSVKHGQIVLLCSLALVVLNNLSASVRFFSEQRRLDFLAHYRKGEFVPVLAMCEQIRKHAGPRQKVLGPMGSIMSVFSGRHVVTQRELFPYEWTSRAPRIVSRAKLRYVVFPARLYEKKEPLIAALMRKHIIVPRTKVATVRAKPAMVLAKPKITVVEGDWRKLKGSARPPLVTKPKKKPTTKATTDPTTHPSPTAQHLRAMTTMLSPVLLADSGAVLSGSSVYGGSLAIREAAASISGPGSSVRTSFSRLSAE
jgi:hypothetical protein